MAGRGYVKERAHTGPTSPSVTLGSWGCTEAASGDDLVDAYAARTLTEHGSPAVVPSVRSTDGTTGARAFNGTSQWADRASDSLESYFQVVAGSTYTLSPYAGITAQAWIYLDSAWSAEGTIIAYEAYGETSAKNSQFRFGISSSLHPFVFWEWSAGADVTATDTTTTLRKGEWIHVAVVIEQDPDNFGKLIATFYVNGDPTSRVANLSYPSGGADAFLQIGASWDSSPDAGATPGAYFNGSLGDVQLLRRGMSWDFIRRTYARAIKDFVVRESFVVAPVGSDSADQLPHFETHARMLVLDRANTAADHRYPYVPDVATPAVPDFGFRAVSYPGASGAIPTGTSIPQDWGTQSWVSTSNTGGSITAGGGADNFALTGGGTAFVNQYLQATETFLGKTIALRVWINNVNLVETIADLAGYGLVQAYTAVPEVHNPTGTHFPQANGAWFTLVFRFDAGSTTSYIVDTAYTTTGTAMPAGAQVIRIGADAGKAAPEMKLGGLYGWDNVTITEAEIKAVIAALEGTGGASHYSAGAADLRWVDLTNYLGENWIKSIKVRDRVEAQAATATVELVTRHGLASLSPARMTENEVQGVDSNTNPLLDSGAVVRIETAQVPVGSYWPLSRVGWTLALDDDHRQALDAHWMLAFHGVIVPVKAGDAGTTLELVDLMGPLQDQWCEPDGSSVVGADFSYGSGAGVALETNLQAIVDSQQPARLPLFLIDDSGPANAIQITCFGESSTYALGYGRPHLFVAGEKIYVTGTTNYNGGYTIASVAGQVLTTVETAGGRAAETAGVVWGTPRNHGYIAARHGRNGSHELYTPTSPSWNQRTYNAGHAQPVASLLEEQAAQVQWNCRFVWDDDLAEFRLTLSRTPSSDTHTISPRLVRKIEAVGFDSSNERNIVPVEYSDDSATDTNGGRPRRLAMSTTTPSGKTVRTRRRYARVGLNPVSTITDSTAAATLGANIIADCDTLTAPDVQLEMVYLPELDLGDTLYVLGEENADTSSPFSDINAELEPRAFMGADTRYGSIVSLEHTFDVRGARSVVVFRQGASAPGRGGKVAEVLEGHGQVAGTGSTPVDSAYATAPIVIVIGIAGGIYVTWALPTTGAKQWDYSEIHIDSSSGFTPSWSTRKATVRGEGAPYWGLAAGTYYCKIVHRDRTGTIVSTSASASFTV